MTEIDPALLEAARSRGLVPQTNTPAVDPGLLGEAQRRGIAPKSMDMADVVGGAFRNFGTSALNFGESVLHPFMNPGETVRNLWKVQLGIADALGLPSPRAGFGFAGPEASTDQERAAIKAIGKFYVDRYGGVENLKATIAKDPVGVLSDASALMTLGGMGLAQAPGKIGQVGNVVRDVGNTINPLNAPFQAAKGLAKAGAPIIGNLGTHTGTTPLREAAEAGAAGGTRAEIFLDSMRGKIPASAVVDEAKDALARMRIERGNQYRSGMAGVKADTTVLDFTKVVDAVNDVGKIGTFKGKTINAPAASTWQDIKAVVDDWAKSPAADFHTAEGLDALKQAVGNIRSSTQPGTPGRTVADSVYHAIKQQIVKQAPSYANVMKEYEQASDLLYQVEKSLSLGDKASVDTALRKLQSVMRNNVNTNYGERATLVNELSKYGAPNLVPQLAGQSLNAPTPRGLGALQAGGTVAGAFASMQPEVLALLPFQSPRLMGEAAYGAGYLNRIAPRSSLFVDPSQAAFQLGREPYR